MIFCGCVVALLFYLFAVPVIGLRVAIVGTHNPRGRLAFWRARRHDLNPYRVDRSNLGAFLDEKDDRFTHILIDGSAVTPYGIQKITSLFNNDTCIIVMDTKRSAIQEVDVLCKDHEWISLH